MGLKRKEKNGKGEENLKSKAEHRKMQMAGSGPKKRRWKKLRDKIKGNAEWKGGFKC